MSVDVLEQLRVLGERLEDESPQVDVDEVLARVRAMSGLQRGADMHIQSVVAEPLPVTRRLGRVRRHPVLAAAAAVLLVSGVLGLVVEANRSAHDRENTTESTPNDARSVVPEPAVFPVVGDQPGAGDFGTLATSGESPERISALVARRDGDTLRDSLRITATAETPPESPTDTAAPVEAVVGAQRFHIDGRVAEVWTEPYVVPVQHVRFEGEPTLEIAGVDALAFMQAAGPDVLRVVSTDSASDTFMLEIGDLPEGYDLIVEPFLGPRGSVVASISVGNTDVSEGSYVGVELSDPLPSLAAYNPTLTAVDINGHPAWVGSGAGHYVIWQPVPGTFATAGGTESAEDSIALARSVRFVDRATWQDFYNVDGMPPSTEAPVATSPPATPPTTDVNGLPVTTPIDLQRDTPYGPLDYATTGTALPLWPEANMSEPAATTTGYGMHLCDSGYGTKILRVDPAVGPAHAYSGTLCVFIDLAAPRVDALTACATTTHGDNYARCQRRTDDTATAGAGTAARTTASPEQQSAMAAFPTATTWAGGERFTFDLSAAIGPENVIDFDDDTVAVTITTAAVGDLVDAPEDTPGVCFVIDLSGAIAHGCAGHDLLASGLAYGAFQDGDGPIEIVGIVPDEVTTVQIGDTTLTPTNNVWHHTAIGGPASKITATFSDGHTTATL
jgi:hypothetical protein